MNLGDDILRETLRIHAEVDALAARLVQRHRTRLRCGRGCADCCEDDLTALEVEAERIRRGHAELLATGEPHPPGRCALLDAQGACRIYEDRPYVCRTQGLPFRWWGTDPHGEPEERRDICPLNEAGEPLLSLAAGDCWLLGPFESRLSALQAKAGAPGRRVALRSLFRRG